MIPKPNHQTILLTSLLTLTTACFADDTPFGNYLPPGINAIATVNIHKLANDPLTSEILSASGMEDARTKLAQVQVLSGIDLYKDIQQISFARDMYAHEDESLLAIRGKFDASRIRAIVGLAVGDVQTTSIASAKEVLTWKVGADERIFLTFLPDDLTLITFRADVMEKTLGQTVGDKSVFEKIDPEFRALNTNLAQVLAWGHITKPAGRENPKSNPVVHVDQINAVIDANTSEIVARVRAKIDSPEHAKDLVDMANGMVALGKLKFNTLGQRVSIGTDESSSTIVARMDISRDEVRNLIRMVTATQGRRINRDKDGSTTESHLARKNAQQARKNAELARKRAELIRKRVQLDRDRMQLERSLQALENESDPLSSASSRLQEPPFSKLQRQNIAFHSAKEILRNAPTADADLELEPLIEEAINAARSSAISNSQLNDETSN